MMAVVSGRGETRQLVNRELAEIGAADLGGESGLAGGGVFLVAPLHLEHRRPDGREQLVEGGVIEGQARGGDARAGLGDDVGGDVGEFRRLVEREFRREVEGDVAGEQAALDEGVLTDVELAADGLVVGVEGPRDLAAVEAGLQLREHAAVAHALDALALMPLGNVRADEGERHGVEPVGQHGVDVVDELAGDGILVGRQAHLEGAHRPLHRRPVQRGETRADAQRAAAELGGAGGEDRRGRVVLLDEVLQREEVDPRSREERGPRVGHTTHERGTRAVEFHAQSPAAFSTSVNSPAGVAKRLLAYSVTLPALTSAWSAGQSRQKSGETQGLDAMRRLFWRRN